jgi:hypothetical protein
MDGAWLMVDVTPRLHEGRSENLAALASSIPKASLALGRNGRKMPIHHSPMLQDCTVLCSTVPFSRGRRYTSIQGPPPIFGSDCTGPRTDCTEYGQYWTVPLTILEIPILRPDTYCRMIQFLPHQSWIAPPPVLQRRPSCHVTSPHRLLSNLSSPNCQLSQPKKRQEKTRPADAADAADPDCFCFCTE